MMDILPNEFQVLFCILVGLGITLFAHPPLYWRIHMLSSQMSWKGARRKWMVGRLKESLPDLRKVSAKN